MVEYDWYLCEENKPATKHWKGSNTFWSMAGTGKNMEKSSESLKNSWRILKYSWKIKELLPKKKRTKSSLETQITSSHSDFLEEIDAVDKKAKEALQIPIGQCDWDWLAWKSDTQGKIKSEIKENQKVVVKKYTEGKFLITKIKALIKGILIEFKDLSNQTMWSTMSFKNTPEENEST